jgi:hypothetical protein
MAALMSLCSVVSFSRSKSGEEAETHRVPPRQLVRVVVAPLDLGTHALVAQVRQVRVVELHKPRAGVVQRAQLLAVHGREVLEEHLEVRVRGLADGAAAAAEVHHGRARDAHLCRHGPVNLQLGGRARELAAQKDKVVDGDGARPPQLARDGDDGRLLQPVWPHGPVVLLPDAVELRQEVEVEVLSPRLAVRDGAQPRPQLRAHELRDGRVLGRSQARGVEGAGGPGGAGRAERDWAQEGADLVGAVDAGRQRHVCLSFFLLDVVCVGWMCGT